MFWLVLGWFWNRSGVVLGSPVVILEILKCFQGFSALVLGWFWSGSGVFWLVLESFWGRSKQVLGGPAVILEILV